MTPEEIATLKKAVETKYRDLFEQLAADKKKELEAIEIVAMLSNAEPLPSSVARPSHPAKSAVISGTTAIHEAINHVATDFTINEVRKFLEKNHPDLNISRNSLHSVFRRLKERDEITVVEPGAGRAPAVYRKTSHYNSN